MNALLPDTNTAIGRATNRLCPEDEAVHRWYRFVLSFPPHLVRRYAERFELRAGEMLLDPFCGTGTTPVEAKRLGLRGVGLEANAMAHFAATVKSDWNANADLLTLHSQAVADEVKRRLCRTRKLRELPNEQNELLLADSISPVPLHKTLVLRDVIRDYDAPGTAAYQRLALASSTVRHASNLKFGPEVGVMPVKRQDADVVGHWLQTVEEIAADLRIVQSRRRIYRSQILQSDARLMRCGMKPGSIDAVFTSPPYPNEKDYTRTTRLESVLLGYLSDKNRLRDMKRNLLRSNSRNIYKEDSDDRFVRAFPCVTAIADRIEARRLELGKTSGFEKAYHKIVRHYFGGLLRHLESLKPLLKRGARLGYVVGDQASFFQVPIPTGTVLAELAGSSGYEVLAIDLFRTRFATKTRTELREEVVVLRWNGS